MTIGQVEVRGGATAEEIGAVLAVLSLQGERLAEPEGYELWRRNRLRVLRSGMSEPGMRTNHQG